MTQLFKKSWYNKAMDWSWVVLVIVGIIEQDFVWYAVAMVWGGFRMFANIALVETYIAKAGTSTTTEGDLWSEHVIASTNLKRVLGASAVAIIFVGFAFGSIFYNQNSLDKAVEDVCVFEEQLDWEHNAKLASAIQNVCQSRRGYIDE